MARIAGVDLPRQKHVVIALTYIFGIGNSRSRSILETAKVDDGDITSGPAVRQFHPGDNLIAAYAIYNALVDKTALVEIYNRMMTPARPKTTGTYSYAGDRVMYSRTIGTFDCPASATARFISAGTSASVAYQYISGKF